MDAGNIASIIVAIVAAFAAWSSSRASARAVSSSSRTNAETEAYQRARAMDVETIQRQEQKIQDLEIELGKCEDEVAVLKEKIRRLENGVPISLEHRLLERLAENAAETASKEKKYGRSGKEGSS